MGTPTIRIEGVTIVPVRELKPHPKNPNKHSADQLDRLAKIIEFQGWRYPVKVSKRSGFVTSGHGRIEAATLRGWTEIPVSYQDYDSDEQEYADVVSDNAIAEWAELDLSSINLALPDLGPEFDVDLLGIKDFVMDLSENQELDEKQKSTDPDQKFILEVQLPSEQDMIEVYNDLLSRGFIVKYR